MKINVKMIQDFMKKYEITVNKLGRLSHISRRSLQNILNNSKNTTYYALEQLAKFMEIDISKLVE